MGILTGEDDVRKAVPFFVSVRTLIEAGKSVTIPKRNDVSVKRADVWPMS